jgi:hypothetical protein
MISVPLLAALSAATLAACSAAGSGEEAAAAAPGPPPTVEQLAAKAGCTPKMQVDAAELRTGYCKTSIGEFFVNTFTTQQGKDAWMDQAPEYNPHLVGDIWTILGPRKVLDQVRLKVGGDLHLTDHRVTPTPPAG